jgi:hypothetical protein
MKMRDFLNVLPFLVSSGLAWAQDQKLCTGAAQASQCVRRFEELHQQIDDLRARLKAGTKVSTLVLQDKCANRALWDFENWGYKAKESPDFVGHYNVGLDLCFIQTQNTLAHGKFFWRELYDAYSGEVYGRLGIDSDHKTHPIMDCDVKALSGETQYCHSDEEFSQLATVYMGRGH